MKGWVLLLCGLAMSGPSALFAQQPTRLDQLVERRGVYLDPQTLEPHNGPVVSMWNDTLVRERGTLLNGRWDGVHETFYLEGQLELRETYRNGVLNGPFEGWFREGEISDRGTYRDGRLEGPYESFWSRAMMNNVLPHPGGRATMGGETAERGAYSAGEPCGEWYRWVPLDGGGMRGLEPIVYRPCPASGG
ncbi:MAG: toxin-antitoxin system YwqK family antitoxin [Gemmatimonadales bacterium]